MAKEMISTPQSMTGIMSFGNATLGGPTLDPRAVIVFSVAFIAVVKIITIVMNVV
ncbi:preprotein translocase subunit Sec61beta [Candidatus Micrarchaeota archaeon]|nr:preprotein translocase subunit Sec61beta [Candidatus Micrarchaeota archaeon]